MGIRFYQPYEELRGIVARIYAHESAPSEPGDLRWLIVPDGDVKLIFPFAGAISCRIGQAERVHPAARLIVSGMRTLPGGLSFPDGVDAIGVIIRPDAAYRLLRVPHLEIVNGTFDGEELFDRWACRLQSELSDLPREEDRVARLQSRLCERLREYRRRDHAFEHAVNRLKQREGRFDINGLAQEVGWSRRHLERTFLERAGIGPKAFASVLRFHAVYKRMRASDGGSYAPLIHDHYYDQSHFLKAFKRYTGITPRVYLGAPDYGRIYIPD
jgi:AraC-like DNA-binding protein